MFDLTDRRGISFVACYLIVVEHDELGAGVAAGLGGVAGAGGDGRGGQPGGEAGGTRAAAAAGRRGLRCARNLPESVIRREDRKYFDKTSDQKRFYRCLSKVLLAMESVERVDKAGGDETLATVGPHHPEPFPVVLQP